MDIKEAVKKIDHTQLKAFATEQDIDHLCEEALELKTASVCIPPSYVAYAHQKFGDALNVCTVIGFPLGYQTKETKVYEANSIRYAEKMPPDFATVLLKDYMYIEDGFKEKLLKIPEFSHWMSKRGNLLNGLD